MSSFTAERKINAPVTDVWQALAAIGDIYLWNPGVVASHTTATTETGVGAARYCDLGDQNYLEEEVVVWEPEERLTMRITGTNMPFATANIRFYLRPENGGTIVTVSPQYTLKWGPLGALLDAVYVRRSYRRGMESLLAGLQQYVESKGRQTSNNATE